MASVSRLAGALLLETRGDYYLVGNTKEPCDWSRAGFDSPVDVGVAPFLRLTPSAAGAPIAMTLPLLTFDVEGEDAARRLVQRFVIPRNGSVSERLWRMVLDPDLALDEPAAAAVDAAWLFMMPDAIWTVVRDAVLRCL